MNELKTEFEYIPKVQVMYVLKGEMTAANKIVVKAPTNTILAHVTTLEQAMASAQDGMIERASKLIGREAVAARMEQSENNVEELKKQAAKIQETADTIVETLFGGKADMHACFKALQAILTSSNSERQPFCLVDGEVAMNQTIFNSMNPVDAKGLLGEYIRNFIIASPIN